MNRTFKNQNVLVIVFEILVIALGIGGITYATSKLLNDRTMTIITAGEYHLDYKGDTEILFKDLEPVSDNLIGIDTNTNVVRVAFSVRGVKNNKADDLIYDVMLEDMNIDCSLLNKYVKWNLYKNGTLISNGSLDPAFDGNVLSENMRLTTIQQDLKDYNEPYDDYVLLFWLSESCNDLTKCQLVDQSNMLNSNMQMKVFIALYSGEKREYERIPNHDNSCANKPELADGMIPVTYKNGSWIVADNTNSNKNNLWYDYSNGLWANAIIVKDQSKYTNASSIIDDKDVIGYFVWIPRFRYKLWNAENELTDSYNAYEDGIEIMFENGLTKTNSEIKNNNYLTHPAFNDNLRGFWISKYEISKEDNNYRFISNKESYRNDTLDNYKSIIASLTKNNNIAKLESHMITNMEWGATLYLSHSKYGVCKNDGCDSIGTNDTYISGNNKQDTTTRNIYGVYDMAGGSSEYVTGNSVVGTATKEVMLKSGEAWYKGASIVSARDFVLRGGIGRGLFYFGDPAMENVENSTRAVLIKETT